MFRDEPITPIRPEAAELASLFDSLVEAKAELDKARESVPSYTGQWSDEDYYAEELSAYNEAANALLAKIESLKGTG